MNDLHSQLFTIIKQITVDPRNKFFVEKKNEEAHIITTQLVKEKEERKIRKEIESAIEKEQEAEKS